MTCASIRANPSRVEELRLDLRAVLQRCRADWDISSAELRATWVKDDKSNFHPYGKTQAQVFNEQVGRLRGSECFFIPSMTRFD